MGIPEFILCRDDPRSTTYCGTHMGKPHLIAFTRLELAELALEESGTGNLEIKQVSPEELRARLRDDDEIAGVIVDRIRLVNKNVSVLDRASLLADTDRQD